jgi:hypothetical protein
MDNKIFQRTGIPTAENERSHDEMNGIAQMFVGFFVNVLFRGALVVLSYLVFILIALLALPIFVMRQTDKTVSRQVRELWSWWDERMPDFL